MRFEPVSTIKWTLLSVDLQIVVCTDEPEGWETRAAATCDIGPADAEELIQDLLANPQIRAVVLTDGTDDLRDRLLRIWGRLEDLSGVPREQLDPVRQFVDLYDDDCSIRSPLPAWWPERIVDRR